MDSADVINLVIRIIVYLIAIVIAAIAMYSFDITKITRKNVKPFFKQLLYFLLILGLAYLIGTLFLQFLPKFQVI